MSLLSLGNHRPCWTMFLYGAVLVISFILLGFTANVCAGEDWQLALDYQERMQAIELTRNLDATYLQRRDVVNKFVELGKGPHRKLVQTQLIETLAQGNLQVRESVMEIMARIGSPAYVETLADVLPFEMFHQNRLILLRLLPSFLVQDDAHREVVVDALYADNNGVTDWIRALLRQQPLNPSGRDLDRNRAQVRKQIIAALAGQLDPIGAALRGYDTKRYNTAAREFVFRVLQEYMLGSRHESLETWEVLRPTARVKDLEFIGQTQEVASRMLVEIGAVEAWKEILSLGYVQRTETQEMALASLVKLSLYAHKNWADNEAVLSGTTLQRGDIYNWQQFCNALSSGQQPSTATGSPLLLKLWKAFPAEIQEAIILSKQDTDSPQGRLTETEEISIINTLNKIIITPEFCESKGEYDSEIARPEIDKLLARKAEGLSAPQVKHLNRLLLEVLFPHCMRRHSFWHELKTPEMIWRKEQQDFCEKTVQSAYELAINILADEKAEKTKDVRLQAYRALGASKQPEAITILRNDALRVGTSPQSRNNICWALGEIGGIESVRVLGQLAQYKGYSSRSFDRRDEYKQVCAAVQALGQVLSRWDDRGSKPALEELLQLLIDKRTIPELPDLPSISQQALYELQTSLQVGLIDLTPPEWRDYNKKFYLKNAGTGITSIPTTKKLSGIKTN